MPTWEIYSYFYSLSLRNSFPYRRLLQDLSNALNIKEGDCVLDAGCGPGLAIERIMKENKGKAINITGLDLSRRMIRHARKRCGYFPNVNLQVADLNKGVESPDSYFDKVICSNTLYALENPRKVLLEFHRVLKPGGAVVIANPKPNAGEKELIKDHVTAINRLTPIYRKIYHIVMSLSLIPVNLVVMMINKLIIQKGKNGEYHFWGREELHTTLHEAGFKNISISSCYADQDWLARAET